MDLNVVKKMNENRNEIGIYVLSFDMKYPMVFWEGKPGSKNLISDQMIKIGKAKKLSHRMKQYERTYGYRASEPNLKSVRDYYAEKGITDLNFNKCNGCDSKEPHHHIKQEYFRSTGLIFTDDFEEENFSKEVEGHIKIMFKKYQLKGFDNKGSVKEYFHKSQLKNIIKEIDWFISKKEKNINNHPTDLIPTDLDIFFAKIYLPILIEVAKSKKCISYGDLVAKSKALHPNDEQIQKSIPRHVGRRLNYLRQRLNLHNLPDLSSLVINNTTQTTGYSYHLNPTTEQKKVFKCDWNIPNILVV